jgi:hypothetical protein
VDLQVRTGNEICKTIHQSLGIAVGLKRETAKKVKAREGKNYYLTVVPIYVPNVSPWLF